LSNLSLKLWRKPKTTENWSVIFLILQLQKETRCQFRQTLAIQGQILLTFYTAAKALSNVS
jgi:hypothetical protein